MLDTDRSMEDREFMLDTDRATLDRDMCCLGAAPSTSEAMAGAPILAALRKKAAAPPRARRRCCSRFALVSVAVFAALLAAVPPLIGRTVWWAGYDLRNCAGCEARIDWSAEMARPVVNRRITHNFRKDGVVVLSQALEHAKVASLAAECDRLPNTFMTHVIAGFLLRFYLRYEHRLDTRSELIRDWAVHGPLGAWAAQLLGASEVRLYNAEMIFHRGEDSPTCRPAWHRDTLAAPFAPGPRAVTFNVYLEDISADGDGLIYQRGSHRNLDAPPSRDDIARPAVRVGDVLAHDPNAYHTTSGVGCWRRRSLQFRCAAG
jgi:hypothetical protein